jgi:hypothetical protein
LDKKEESSESRRGAVQKFQSSFSAAVTGMQEANSVYAAEAPTLLNIINQYFWFHYRSSEETEFNCIPIPVLSPLRTVFWHQSAHSTAREYGQWIKDKWIRIRAIGAVHGPAIWILGSRVQVLTKDGQAPDKRKRNRFGRIFQVRTAGGSSLAAMRFRSDDES